MGLEFLIFTTIAKPYNLLTRILHSPRRYVMTKDVPEFLLAVLPKGLRANVSAAERNAMRQAATRLRESLSTRVGSKGRAR